MWRLLLIVAALSSAFAEEGPKPCAFVNPTIDHGPQVPDTIQKPRKIIPLGCERPFAYRGLVYSADTPQSQDAAVLKSFVQSVPESNELLEQYQSNRRKSKISAYTGTAGLLIFAFSHLISLNFEANARDSINNALRIGGLSLAAGGFIYSFALLRTNELLLPKAVNTYNQSKPNDPIELQFSASWGF